MIAQQVREVTSWEFPDQTDVRRFWYLQCLHCFKRRFLSSCSLEYLGVSLGLTTPAWSSSRSVHAALELLVMVVSRGEVHLMASEVREQSHQSKLMQVEVRRQQRKSDRSARWSWSDTCRTWFFTAFSLLEWWLKACRSLWVLGSAWFSITC